MKALTWLAVGSVSLSVGCFNPDDTGGSGGDTETGSTGSSSVTMSGTIGETTPTGTTATVTSADTGTETSTADCGDGEINGDEECDGEDLGGATCEEGGTISCAGDCTLDTSMCVGAPTTPALFRPYIGQYVGSGAPGGTGSRRPEFEWRASSADEGTIEYEIQYDADPDFGDPTAATTENLTFRPADDLPINPTPPVGERYHWRVRACVDTACSQWSDAWYVNVGRSEKDTNGDGFADLLVASGFADQAEIFLGAPGPSSFSATTLTEPAITTFADDVIIAGDLDADGFADVAVGSLSARRVYIYLGNSGGTLDETADVILEKPDDSGFGGYLGAPGDINGDGYDDLLAAAPFTGGGTVFAFFGAESMDNQSDAEVEGAGDDRLGWSVSGARDVNGDGYADVVAGGVYDEDAPGFGPGRAKVFFGASDVSFGNELDVPGQVDNGWFGYDVGGGDLDGDGYSDVIVGARSETLEGNAYVYLGSDDFENGVDISVMGAAGDRWFGYTAGYAGDLDADGIGEWYVGSVNSTPERVYIYSGNSDTADFTITGPDSFILLGRAVARLGDFNGDAIDDFATGAASEPGPNPNFDEGSVRIYFGDANGFDIIDDHVVWGDPGDAFGSSID